MAFDQKRKYQPDRTDSEFFLFFFRRRDIVKMEGEDNEVVIIGVKRPPLVCMIAEARILFLKNL
jgi:hypothetical protein